VIITKEAAIQKFRDILSVKTAWKILAKSQFLNHLAVFMSWVLREALWKIERTYQEYFLSTALNASSIRAHAEDRAYLPRKKTPASGAGTIKNNGTVAVSLPSGQALSSDADLDYVTDRALLIAAGVTAAVEFIQKTRLEAVHTVTEEKAFYEIVFDEDLSGELTAEQAAKICNFTVYVNVNGGLGYELWAYSRLFQNAYPGDQVYDEFYAHTGQTGIRFGNEYVGEVLPVGALVKIILELTDGDTSLAEGQQLALVGEVLDMAGQVADLTITATEAVTDGQDAEPIEEIRNNLKYWPVYNEKLVWRDDYIFFIKQAVADILWLKVWGETEMEAAYGPNVLYINKIFVTAYAADRTDLEEEIFERLNELSILNRKFEWVEPAFSTFSLTITGKVASSVVIADAQAAIIAALTENYGKDSASRLEEVRVKDFYSIIDGTGYFDAAGAYFEVSHSGVTEATDLHEMVHIDMDTTTITLEYI